MKKRVLINGLGRIGRAIARNNLESDVFDLVAINDINPDNKNIAYLLKYDSSFGTLKNHISSDADGIMIDGKKIRVSHEHEIGDVDLSDIDIVVESSGVKSNVLQIEDMANKSTVEQFVISNADSQKAQNVIFGVNENVIKDRTAKIISASTCDAIALAPVYRVLENYFGIESGFLTTLHPWVSYQNLLDGSAKSQSLPDDVYSSYALGRASVMSLIPKSTSAVLVLSKLFPDAIEKLRCFSYRTPTSLVSSAVLSAVIKRNVSREEIIAVFKAEEKKQKWNVFHTTDLPLTSVDYIGNEFSVVIDTRWIQTINDGKHIEVVYWYDNEWGYSSRIVDIIKYLSC